MAKVIPTASETESLPRRQVIDKPTFLKELELINRLAMAPSLITQSTL
jgi:hypothetical protein